MREIPILFSTPMVQAIFAGNKTMTRRIIKPQPPKQWDKCKPVKNSTGEIFSWDFYNSSDRLDHGYLKVKCPYGQPGDRLYVKEAIKRIDWADGIPGIAYVADNEPVWDMTRPCQWVWKNKGLPSMYMPKSIARIWLEVVSVRVERLQDITEQDARAEGVMPDPRWHYQYCEVFARLWDSLNKNRGFSWDSNPFVWVIEFGRLA